MHEFEGFTLDYYREVVADTRLIIIMINTLVIALLSSAIATLIAIIGALAIQRVRSRRAKNTLLSLNNVLIVSPDVIIGASFLILFTIVGIKLGFVSVLLSHVAFSISDCRYHDSAASAGDESTLTDAPATLALPAGMC
jgi:spermidine/putrescine transport system permease protein